VDGRRFSDEIIASSWTAASRWSAYATSIRPMPAATVRGHPVPSRDGTRVLFATTGGMRGGCGASTDIKDYVVADSAAGGERNPPPVANLFALEEIANPAQFVLSSFILSGLAPPPRTRRCGWAKRCSATSVAGPGRHA